MSSQNCHIRFFIELGACEIWGQGGGGDLGSFVILIFVIENMKFKKRGWYSLWQCSQYLELNLTCDLAYSQKTVPNIRWLP